jgi:hypothetical protein
MLHHTHTILWAAIVLFTAKGQTNLHPFNFKSSDSDIHYVLVHIPPELLVSLLLGTPACGGLLQSPLRLDLC